MRNYILFSLELPAKIISWYKLWKMKAMKLLPALQFREFYSILLSTKGVFYIWSWHSKRNFFNQKKKQLAAAFTANSILEKPHPLATFSFYQEFLKYGKTVKNEYWVIPKIPMPFGKIHMGTYSPPGRSRKVIVSVRTPWFTLVITFNPISRLLFWARGQKTFSESLGLLYVGLWRGNEEI